MPTNVNAVPGDRQATLSWSAPASDGGSAISGYAVTSSPGNLSCATSGALSCVVGGLANGTPYTFTVTATNTIGTGPPSGPSSAVTPASVPGAPSNVSAVAANGQATVSWSGPASDGGSAINGYTVTSDPGSLTCTTGGSLSCVVGGLANGTPYTFTVTATNTIGTGPPSVPSSGVTPASVPGAPTNVSATAWQCLGHGELEHPGRRWRRRHQRLHRHRQPGQPELRHDCHVELLAWSVG